MNDQNHGDIAPTQTVTRGLGQRGRPGFTRLRALAVVAVLSTVALLSSPVAASADTWVSSGFEGDPSLLWRGTAWDGAAGFEIGQGTARSGSNNGWLFVNTWGSAEMVTWENFFSSTPWWSICTAELWVQPSVASRVEIDIWDARGRLLGYGIGELSAGSYQRVITGSWELGVDKPVQIQLYVVGGGQPRFIRMDDLFIHCVG